MDIKIVIDWVIENYKVLISGIAVPFIYFFITKFLLKKKDIQQIKQTQKSRKKSINIQSGRDVKINKKDV